MSRVTDVKLVLEQPDWDSYTDEVRFHTSEEEPGWIDIRGVHHYTVDSATLCGIRNTITPEDIGQGDLVCGTCYSRAVR